MAQNPLSATNPTLALNEIPDTIIRKNFQNLRDYFDAQNQLLAFQFAELSFTEAQNGYVFLHSLGFVPQDIIVSRITGTGKVSFLYDQFDAKQIILDVDGPCRIRFFYGTYWNFTTSLDNNDGDKMIISSGV